MGKYCDSASAEKWGIVGVPDIVQTQTGQLCQHCGAEITAPGDIIVVKKRLLIAAAVFYSLMYFCKTRFRLYTLYKALILPYKIVVLHICMGG